jgi:ParB family chromosome partitioning protein
MPHALDPTTCRPRYQAHSRIVPTLCQSLKANGQITPALVRPIPPDPDNPHHHYEIICGHRRHATILHLNRNGFQIPFLANIQDLTDAEAFRTADIDNRERADIPAYHRAQAYAQALAAHYGNNQATMAKSLNLATSTVARYLALAGLPEPILNAFHDRDAIRFSDAAILAPLLRSLQTADRILIKAKSLASIQNMRHMNGQKLLSPDTILLRLKETAEAPVPTTIHHEIRNPDGILIVTGHHTRNGRLTLTLTVNPNITLHEKLAAADKLITTLSG